ncbi:uncharacterized protein JCM6883_003906 [Sporobolomyces salmoneus]|uniref:uncharacterized protein n=1 Tax=Sporobolomyces salmoneus TaxID=183962 RepID=UPI003180DA35
MVFYPEGGDSDHSSSSTTPKLELNVFATPIAPEDWNRATSSLAWSRGEAKALFEVISPITLQKVITSYNLNNKQFDADNAGWGRIGSLGLDVLLRLYDENGKIAIRCTITWTARASLRQVPTKTTLPHFDEITVADLVFRFPRDEKKRFIFASKSILSRNAEYFDTLFSSGFAETSEANSTDVSNLRPNQEHSFTFDGTAFSPFYLTTTQESAQVNTDPPELASLEASNAAAEDSPRLEKRARVDESVSSTSRRIQVIDITETDFTTYRAMVCFLYCREVLFTALPSDYLVARDKALAEHPPSDSSFAFDPPELWLPTKFKSLKQQRDNAKMPPSCPHSMYRLADCYNLDKLKRLTKDRILRCLTVENVAYELFSPLSIDYEEIRKPVLEYFVKNWEEVKKTTAFNNVVDKVTDGELKHAKELVATFAHHGSRFLSGRRQVLFSDGDAATVDVYWGFFSSRPPQIDFDNLWVTLASLSFFLYDRRAHTNATVSISSDGKTATLEMGDQTFLAELRSPSNATFGTAAAERTSALPALHDGSVDQPNPGVTVLTIDIAAPSNEARIDFSFQSSLARRIVLLSLRMARIVRCLNSHGYGSLAT